MKSRYSARHAGAGSRDARRRRDARDRRRGRGAGTARRRRERHASVRPAAWRCVRASSVCDTAGQRRAQSGRGQRHAGDRFEHVSGTPMLEHPPIARQQQRRVVVHGGKHKNGRAKRGRRFDVGRGRLRETELQAGPKALAVDPAADGDFRGQRADGPTGREGLGERVRAVTGGGA